MKKLTIVIAALAALVFSNAANAAVVFGSPGVATGVTGLNVGGTIYDVGFVAFAPISDIPSTIDFSTELEAIDAATALNAALNAAFATSIDFAGGFNYIGYALPYEYAGTLLKYYFSAYNTVSPDAWAGQASLQFDCSSCNSSLYLADFTRVSAVPLPAGGVLLLTGLVGLAAMRRSKGVASRKQ